MAIVKCLTLVVVWKSLLFFADAQFPRSCTDAVSFGRRECCPVPAGMADQCGGGDRGRCANFTDPTPTNQTGWPTAYNLDDRRRWPSVLFTRFCRCEANFAGADCSKCKWGFYGPNCTETRRLTRKSVLNLTAAEKAKFVAYVNNTKYAQSDYVVASEFYVNATVVPQFRNVSVYDYFVYQQHYTDVSSSSTGLDFSHRSTGFATWNRAILLAFERAVQEVNADYDFALPYYDWTESPSCNSSSICSNELLGANNASGALDDTSVFSRWETVCVQSNTSNPCDVNVKTGQIVRKAGSGSLPTQDEVNFALRFTAFDKADYSGSSECSFRNLLEGFVDTKTGLHDPNRGYLNRQVHMALGGQEGTMSELSYATNDPIFYVHRAFIDRIFEQWLRRHNVTIEDAIPESGAAPGHNRNENIVPFFPPFSHADMYKKSTELGYDYADIDSNGPSGSALGPNDCPVPLVTTTPNGNGNGNGNGGDNVNVRTTAGPMSGGFTGGLIAGLVVAAALGLVALGLLVYCATTSWGAKPAPSG